jgi:hypothetical protein
MRFLSVAVLALMLASCGTGGNYSGPVGYEHWQSSWTPCNYNNGFYRCRGQPGDPHRNRERRRNR